MDMGKVAKTQKLFPHSLLASTCGILKERGKSAISPKEEVAVGAAPPHTQSILSENSTRRVGWPFVLPSPPASIHPYAVEQCRGSQPIPLRRLPPTFG
jgi:hypothetical protein